jgi:hypothetical protein
VNQNTSPKAAFSSSITLICCALIAFAVGVSIICLNTKGAWWVGLLLSVGGFLIGINGFRIYRAGRMEEKIASEQLALFNKNKEGPEARKTKVQILVNWVYSASEWKEFLKWEKKKSSSNSYKISILLILISGLGLHYLLNLDWVTALVLSLVVGILYSLIIYFINVYSTQPDDNKMPEVIITSEVLIINGYMSRFSGNELRLAKITVNDAGSFNVLEITYCWNTTRGKNFDEIRVPIPKGSLKEAIFLQEKLMSEKKLADGTD